MHMLPCCAAPRRAVLRPRRACNGALPSPPPNLQITLAGGKGQPAKVVGYDEDKDVAVLQIDMKEMVSLDDE